VLGGFDKNIKVGDDFENRTNKSMFKKKAVKKKESSPMVAVLSPKMQALAGGQSRTRE
jgi:hypothetical protein